MLQVVLKREGLKESDLFSLEDLFKILDSNPLMDSTLKILNNEVKKIDQCRDFNNQILL